MCPVNLDLSRPCAAAVYNTCRGVVAVRGMDGESAAFTCNLRNWGAGDNIHVVVSGGLERCCRQRTRINTPLLHPERPIARGNMRLQLAEFLCCERHGSFRQLAFLVVAKEDNRPLVAHS